MSKIMITLSEDLLAEINKSAQELKTNRSKLFRQAISKYLAELKQKKFEKLMAEGYQEMAKEDLRDAVGFLNATSFLKEE